MCMLVLGTHRSGTSITTALVQAQGFALGQPLLHVGDENPLGHFEHEHVLAMHEAFLAEVGLQWFDRVDPLALAGAERRQRWQAEIAEQYAGISEGLVGSQSRTRASFTSCRSGWPPCMRWRWTRAPW